MKTKDVDKYLRELNQTQDENEKIELSKRFFGLFKESIIATVPDGSMYFIDMYQDILQYCVTSGAFEKCFDIGFKTIPDLSRQFIAIVTNAEDVTFDKEYYKEKFKNQMGKALSDSSMLNEDGNPIDFDAYDKMFAQYFYLLAKDENFEIDDVVRNSLETIKSSLPEGKNLRETKVYSTQIVRNLDNESVLGILPKVDEQTLVSALGKDNKEVFDENGKIKNAKKYDEILFEYLNFYGKDEINFDIVLPAYEEVLKGFSIGNLRNSISYSKFLLNKTERDDVQKLILSDTGRLSKDLMARIHEKSGRDDRCSDFEFEIFKEFYMPKDIDIETEFPETFEEMKQINPNASNILHYPGYLQEFISELDISSSMSSVGLAQYVIRLQKEFKAAHRPENEYLAQVYDYIKDLDIVSLLKNNLSPKLISSADSQKVKFADEALALIFEADFKEGEKLFFENRIIDTFKNAGMPLFETKSMTSLVQSYINETQIHETPIEGKMERLLAAYIKYQASQPNFNILKNQNISDLMQLAWTGNTEHGKPFLNALITGLNETKTYIPREKSKEIADKFIEKFTNKPVTKEDEKEFEEFLNSLSTLKISNRGMLTQKQVDFLLNQALRKNSIMNSNRDKYGFVLERAIEDLGKLDNIKQMGNPKIKYLYMTRDYISRESVMGRHTKILDSRLGMKKVTLKREVLQQFYEGNLESIDTIFHENTHMNQTANLSKTPKSFARYNMIKEDIIMARNPKYYRDNYKLTYIEIEAREKGNEKAAKYLSEIMPEERALEIADDLRNSVVSMFESKLKETKQAFEEASEREQSNYKRGLIKKDRTGKKSSLIDLFDRELRLMTTSERYNMFQKYPGLSIEYHPNGDKRTFLELIGNSCKEDSKLDLEMMSQIIIHGRTLEKENGAQPIAHMIKFLSEAKNDEQIKFLNDIIENSFAPYLERYATNLKPQTVRDYNGIKSDVLLMYAVADKVISKR